MRTFFLVVTITFPLLSRGRPVDEMNHYEVILKTIEMEFTCFSLNLAKADLKFIQNQLYIDKNLDTRADCIEAQKCLENVNSYISRWRTGDIKDSYQFKEKMAGNKSINIFKSDYMAPFEKQAQIYSSTKKRFAKGTCGYIFKERDSKSLASPLIIK